MRGEVVTDSALSNMYSLVTAAHAQIQNDFDNIDPIVSVNRQMRSNGIPADAMTIDCLKTGKRIILIFHDEQPDVISYQFCLKDKDPYEEWQSIPYEDVTTKQLYDWMKQNFFVV